jgi:hypothetical protein
MCRRRTVPNEKEIIDAPAPLSCKREHDPEPPAAPLEKSQVDFKDVSTVPPDQLGKRQHVIETCNFVDAGTSLLLMAEPHDDFHAQTALEAVIAFLRRCGCPERMSVDPDPQFWPIFL